MGKIRFLLAASVVVYHSHAILGFEFVGGKIAVELFFIISGFYIAMILAQKYQQQFWVFFSNRLLKIFPCYWLIAGISALLYALVVNLNIIPEFTAAWQQLDGRNFILFMLSNIFIIGQDIFMFTGLDPETQQFYFAPAFHSNQPGVLHFLFVPQAWSICLEFCFYAIAPFVVRRRLVVILSLLTLSLLIRFSLFYKGYYDDPFSYRFFPSELCFFLLGVLSFRAYQQGWIISSTLISRLSIVIFCLLILGLKNIIAQPSEWISWVIYISFAALLPTFFNAEKSSRFDRFIGELSYPIYISHVMIIFMIRPFIQTELRKYRGLIKLLLSTILAMILVKYLMQPIDRIRQQRAEL